MPSLLTQSFRNQALVDLYCRHWSALAEAMSRFDGLSRPYLAWVHPDYEQADIRLVVVGKETNGWGHEDQIEGLGTLAAVQLLMARYRNFQLGINYPGKLSFWVPVHELYRRLNPQGLTFGFVALNASKMDQHEAIPSTEVRDFLTPTGLLREEIEILDPHVVVFHTGPRYESWLDGWFPDLERHGDMWLSRVKAAGLPRHSYRSYHPQYLNRRAQRSTIYDRIISETKSA